jgi:hypothetical protein
MLASKQAAQAAPRSSHVRINVPVNVPINVPINVPLSAHSAERNSARIFTLVALAAFNLASTNISSASVIVNYFTRVADEHGLGNVIQCEILGWAAPSIDTTLVGIVRPSGSMAWDSYVGHHRVSAVAAGSSISLSEASAWMDSEGRGEFLVWTPWSSTTIDTTAYYVSPVHRVLPQLDAWSASMFRDLRDDGIMGNITMRLASPSTTSVRWWLYDGSGAAVRFGTIAAGETEFVLSIDDSIGANGKLALWTHDKFGETGAWHHVYNQTIYGGSAVPAPGAIALLSFAIIGGATRARRRA